jgi:RNA recognition motif-containing protein
MEATPVQEPDTNSTPTAVQEAPVSQAPVGKEGRIILRNLPFDIKESHLQQAFGTKFGAVLSISVPVNNANNMNRGFAFLEFAAKADASKAIEALHGSKFKGRVLAAEFSLPKGRYETRVQHIVENTNQARGEVIVPKVVREEREEIKAKKEQAKKTHAEERKRAKEEDKREESRLGPSKTLFVRNISFDTT